MTVSVTTNNLPEATCQVKRRHLSSPFWLRGTVSTTTRKENYPEHRAWNQQSVVERHQSTRPVRRGSKKVVKSGEKKNNIKIGEQMTSGGKCADTAAVRLVIVAVAVLVVVA